MTSYLQDLTTKRTSPQVHTVGQVQYSSNIIEKIPPHERSNIGFNEAVVIVEICVQQNKGGNTSGYNNKVFDAAKCLVQVDSGVAQE